jgi:hypothetical protein
VTRREIASLLPLLAVYVVALFAFPSTPDDEAAYVELAERLTHGAYVSGDPDALLDADPSSPDLWFGPGLPLTIAPLAAVDLPLRLVRLSGPAFLFGAMLLFYLTARPRSGSRVALAGTYAVGLYPAFWPLLPNLHSESLAILLVVASMLGISRFLSGGGRASFALAAAGLAALALTRVAYGWVLTVVFVGAVAWWIARRGPVSARTALMAGVALLLCAPWLAYTYAKTDRPFQWGNSGALSLYWMSSPFPGDRGDWRQADDVFVDPKLAGHRPFFESLRGLPLPEQNRRIERAARENIVHHPDAYFGNIASNLGRMFVNAPYSDVDWEPDDLLYAASSAVLLASVVWSSFVLLPRRRTLPPESGPFLALGVASFVLHALVAAYPRMLAPIVPIVGWFTLLAVDVRRRERRRSRESPSERGVPAGAGSR